MPHQLGIPNIRIGEDNGLLQHSRHPCWPQMMVGVDEFLLPLRVQLSDAPLLEMNCRKGHRRPCWSNAMVWRKSRSRRTLTSWENHTDEGGEPGEIPTWLGCRMEWERRADTHQLPCTLHSGGKLEDVGRDRRTRSRSGLLLRAQGAVHHHFQVPSANLGGLGPPKKVATPTTEREVKLLEGMRIITNELEVKRRAGVMKMEDEKERGRRDNPRENRRKSTRGRQERVGERTTPRHWYCWTKKMHTAIRAIARTKNHGG